MAHSNVILLGHPCVERDGNSVDFDTRKALALLAYLLVTQRRHTRDSIAALLWPEYDQTHARAALRRTLSSLNKALPDCLDVDRDSVGLQPHNGLVVDAQELQRRLDTCRTHGHATADVCSRCVQPLTEAVTLYSEDFMAGFALRDSAAFDDWQLLQAERLRRELESVLDRLIRWHIQEGDYQQALGYARRRLVLDPLHEATHRAVMRLYVWNDQRSAALQQYRDCARVLDLELGVEPLMETIQLFEAIKNNALLAPPTPKRLPAANPQIARPSAPTDSGEARSVRPFVGRAAELDILRSIYTNIRGDGHLVVIEGIAGIGKTRLVEEFLAQHRYHHVPVVVLRSFPDETNLAFGPFIEGVRDALRQPQCRAALAQVPDHALAEAARLVPELGTLCPHLPPVLRLDSPGAQSRFFEGLSQLLLALSGADPPGIVFCDDVQWADAASLDLLAYLVRRMHGRPVYLIMTWRSEHVPQQHRLRQVVAEAQRAGFGSYVTLPPLDRRAVVELVHAALPNVRLPDVVEERLYKETEGIPLFLSEYLAAIADGSLQLSGTDDWSLPGGVRDVLRHRLGTISQAGHQILTAAAVIGRSFDFETLKAVSGRSEDEIIGALEELFGQGLVEEVQGRADEAALRYDFSHEKLRSFVYAETSLTRRRVLHRRVAEALIDRGRVEGTSSDTRPFSLIANHFRLAGHDHAAAHYFQQAGEHARRLYANAEALEHFRTALTLGHPQPAALHEAIGDLLTLQGDYAAALHSYDAAASFQVPDTASALEHKRGIVHQRRGAWALAEQAFAAALGLSDAADAAGRARIFADRSLAARAAGQPGKALEHAQQALELAQAAADTRALAQAHNIVGMLLNHQGDTTTAQQHLQQSLKLAEAFGDPAVRVAALNNLALAYQTTGRLEEATALAEQALALCHTLGDRHRVAAIHNNLADLYHALGKGSAAMQHLKQAVTIFADIGAEAGTLQPAIWKLTEW